MNADQLIALRPTSSTLEAIQDSLARIVRADAELDAQLARLDAERSEMVLTGTARQIADARENVVQATRRKTELIDLRKAVTQQIDVIERAKALATHEELAKVADAKSRDFNKWHAEHYARHAQAIADGLKIEVEARAAHFRLQNYRTSAEDLLNGQAMSDPLRPSIAGFRGHSFGEKVRLPGKAGGPNTTIDGDPPFWWPFDLGDGMGVVTGLRMRADDIARAANVTAAPSPSLIGRARDVVMGRKQPRGTSSQPAPSATDASWDRAIGKYKG